MADLVQWLRAQYDAEAERAVAAGGDDWRRQDHPSDTVAVYDSKGEPVVYDEGWPSEAQAEFIVEWDPARALREIDAKRQLVKLHGRATLRAGGGAQYYDTATVCRSCEPDHQFPELSWPCPTLRLLALPYADRPGYQESWRP